MGVCQAAEAPRWVWNVGSFKRAARGTASANALAGGKNAQAYLYENAALLERVRQGILKHKGIIPADADEQSVNTNGGVMPQA